MNKNPLNKGSITENFTGIGPVNDEMIEARAHELALIAGRVPLRATRTDYNQARRELTGEPDLDAEEALFESYPESERWDPVPGSIGHQQPVSTDEDEDDEGHSNEEMLIEEGIREAEHDQMLQAAQEARKADQQDQSES